MKKALLQVEFFGYLHIISKKSTFMRSICDIQNMHYKILDEIKISFQNSVSLT